MAQRRRRPATGLAVAWAMLAIASGCGGTLEGKYRRGQLTTTSTSGPRAPATNGTAPPSTTTTTSVPTSGNAAHRAAPGEPGSGKPGGTIVGSAIWRAVVPPSGGRHR